LRVAAWAICVLLSIALSRTTAQTQAKKEIPPATAKEIADLKQVLAARPDDPAALFNLALDYAQIGEGKTALDLLEKMAQAHSGLDPKAPAGRPFKDISTEPRFVSLIAQIEKENPPVVRSSIAYLIHERDLCPEGIAYDPVEKKLYLSSLSKRKIVYIGHDGSEKDFKSSGQDGLGDTLGMKVDAQRRILWVVSDAFTDDTSSTRSGLFQYDLKTGNLRFKHLLPPGTSGFLNDVAIASNGEAYVTNTGTGEVFRASPERDGLELFLPAGAVTQANGITLSGDGKTLFVAGWIGVARVDLKSRKVRLLAKARNISDAGLDGLYFYKGALVGIQNPDLHPGRVMRYFLNAAQDRIVRAEVLEAYNPLFDIPTTATLIGDSLLFMANTQLDKRGKNGVMPASDQLQDIKILRLNLKSN
jgi:hypothetical protein